MYLPAHFQQTNPTEMAALMQAYPLATLVHRQCAPTQGHDAAADVASSPAEGNPQDAGQDASLLCADLLPLMWEPDADGRSGWLRGHVARANPLWQQAAGQTVLAIFQGPQAYITPAWYAAKAGSGQVVPTWNYAVVQAEGRLGLIEEPGALLRLVSRLTDLHEAPRQQPWAVSDAPDDYIERLLAAIVGLEIRVTRLTGKWKMSQNRPAADRPMIRYGLAAAPQAEARAMADWIKTPPTD